MTSYLVDRVRGNVANRNTRHRQSSRSRSASMKLGYLYTKATIIFKYFYLGNMFIAMTFTGNKIDIYRKLSNLITFFSYDIILSHPSVIQTETPGDLVIR